MKQQKMGSIFNIRICRKNIENMFKQDNYPDTLYLSNF